MSNIGVLLSSKSYSLFCVNIYISYPINILASICALKLLYIVLY